MMKTPIIGNRDLILQRKAICRENVKRFLHAHTKKCFVHIGLTNLLYEQDKLEKLNNLGYSKVIALALGPSSILKELKNELLDDIKSYELITHKDKRVEDVDHKSGETIYIAFSRCPFDDDEEILKDEEQFDVENFKDITSTLPLLLYPVGVCPKSDYEYLRARGNFVFYATATFQIASAESKYSKGGIIFTTETVTQIRVKDLLYLLHDDLEFDGNISLNIELL